MLTSNLCGYSAAYIFVKGKITVQITNANNQEDWKLAFKNNAPLSTCISKPSNTFIENAKDLDIAMPINNLLEYSDTFSLTSGSFTDYYRDEMNDGRNEKNAAGDCTINNIKKRTNWSFKYKTKIIEKTLINNNTQNARVVVPLKCLIMNKITRALRWW